jgi:penicillin-binding protein 1C
LPRRAGRPPRIETSLDAGLQSDVVGIIRSHRQALDRHGAANVAVVVLDNASGDWLVWEGLGEYSDAEHGGSINGPMTPRQPGSALKPFTYALAFGVGLHAGERARRRSVTLSTAEAGVLSPRATTAVIAVRCWRAARSRVPKTSAVVLASSSACRRSNAFSRARDSTFDRTPSCRLGLTLGNAEVRLAELVAAYSTFARGGDWIDRHAFRRRMPAHQAGPARRSLVSR